MSERHFLLIIQSLRRVCMLKQEIRSCNTFLPLFSSSSSSGRCTLAAGSPTSLILAPPLLVKQLATRSEGEEHQEEQSKDAEARLVADCLRSTLFHRTTT